MRTSSKVCGILRERKILLGLVLMGMVATFFGMPYQALLPVFAEEVLEAGPRGLGYLGMAGGIGGTIGSPSHRYVQLSQSVEGVAGCRVTRRRVVHRRICAGRMVSPACLDSICPAPSSSPSSSPESRAGFFQMVMTGNFSLVQVLTPDQLRGRVMSVPPYRVRISAIRADHYRCHRGDLRRSVRGHSDRTRTLHLLGRAALVLPVVAQENR